MSILRRVVVTGLGFISSIGNSRDEVLEALRSGRSGIEIHPELDKPEIPVKLAGTIKGFSFPTENPEAWKFPPNVSIPRKHLRSMPPHAVYAFAAMNEAIADAALAPEKTSNPRTGMMCASSGSARMMYRHLEKMFDKGVLRCGPFAFTQSIAGTLNFNLLSAFKIQGASTGMISACSSSAHAFGYALDQIRQDRQDAMFVVGAEDCDVFSILPFQCMRALSTSTNPQEQPCAFDLRHNGFVATGGAAVLILEELAHAQKRDAKIYAEALGWGQSSDGYDITAPEPGGKGLSRAMHEALRDADVDPGQIDHINAHATSTVAGDAAECAAMKHVFGKKSPLISGTKNQTGHALSAAGALEAGICCLAIREKFTPVTINVRDLDPACEGLNIVTRPVEHAPQTVMTNSSAFGGSNVSLILRKFEQ
jgi:3-oxoacyl-[acyl-carrier-protein] synthase-1